jgi:DNA-binding helix-hairpin-helix protein with protein kinase domain
VPLTGTVLRMVRTGTPVTVGERLGEGGQGVVHAATFGGFPCAVKWYRPVPKAAELRRSIAALAERGRPHSAFIWPIDVVVSDQRPGFGYVMPRLEPGFISFAQLLGRPAQPSFRAMITIGRHLTRAFEALHASGLCYRDISFGNLWVDPDKAEVAIIDNDNVGLDGGDVFVWGTLRFMAPEVIRREAFPASVTDLYSLAVFLFYLFMHGHPLEGVRTEATFSWGSSAAGTEGELAVRYFGTEPLFVFDRHDDANRPPPGDPMWTWWPIYPVFFREVFERAFTAGLTDSSGAARITEGVWRRALLRLADCVSACPCKASVCYDLDNPAARCWNCGRVPPRPLVLQLPGGTVVVSEGAVITAHHLRRDRDYDTVVAAVEAQTTAAGQVVVRNVGEQPWTMKPDGEPPKRVAPARRLAARPMTIDFGTVRGRILRS